jgi:hypothetical protein
MSEWFVREACEYQQTERCATRSVKNAQPGLKDGFESVSGWTGAEMDVIDISCFRSGPVDGLMSEEEERFNNK